MKIVVDPWKTEDGRRLLNAGVGAKGGRGLVVVSLGLSVGGSKKVEVQLFDGGGFAF